MTKMAMALKTGIYDTEIVARFYGKKKVVLTIPMVRWQNNSGSLDFYKATYSNPETVAIIKSFFDEDTFVKDNGFMLSDVINL